MIAPWYYPDKENATIWVENYGNTGHTLYTIDLISVTFSGGTDYSLQIQIPKDIYEGNMNGACSVTWCPTGGSINTCWERTHNHTTTYAPTTIGTTKLPITATTSRGTTTEYPNCDPETEERVKEECSVIVNSTGPFAVCVTKAPDLANNYYQSCVYDVCAANQSNAICALLQSYADACMKQVPNTVLQWRTESFCRKWSPDFNIDFIFRFLHCFQHQIVPNTCIMMIVLPVALLRAVIQMPQINVPNHAVVNVHAMKVIFMIMENAFCPVTVAAQMKKATIIKYKYNRLVNLPVYHDNIVCLQYGSTWIIDNCEEECTCGDNHTISCTSKEPCDINARCEVRDGDENCYCLPGYTGDGGKLKFV